MEVVLEAAVDIVVEEMTVIRMIVEAVMEDMAIAEEEVVEEGAVSVEIDREEEVVDTRTVTETVVEVVTDSVVVVAQ